MLFSSNKTNISAIGACFGKNTQQCPADVVKQTGIEQIATSEVLLDLVDMAEIAIKDMLQQQNILSESIDAVVFVSDTPDYFTPFSSYALQDKLKLRGDVFLIDLLHSENGFIEGLWRGSLLIEQHNFKHVLVVAANCPFDQDVLNCSKKSLSAEALSVFEAMTEGVSVALLSYSESASINYFYTIQDFDALDTYYFEGSMYCPDTYKFLKNKNSCLKLDWPKFKHYLENDVVSHTNEFLGKTSQELSNSSLCVIQPWSYEVASTIVNRLNLGSQQLIFSAQHIGHCRAASLGLMLSHSFSQQTPPLSNLKQVLLISAGMGLCTSIALLNLENTKFFTPILN